MTPLQRELLRVAPHRDLRLSLSVARRYLARQPIIQPRRRIVVPRSDPRRTRRFRPIGEDTVAAHLRLTNGHLTRYNHLAAGCIGGQWYQVRECCTGMAVRLAVQSSEAWSGAVMIDDWCYYVDAGTSFADLPVAYADAAPLVEASYASCAACNAVYPCDDGSYPCADCSCWPEGTVMLASYQAVNQTDIASGGCCAMHYYSGYVFPLTQISSPQGATFAASSPDPWDSGATRPGWQLGASISCDELGPGGSTRYFGSIQGQLFGMNEADDCYAFNISHTSELCDLVARCGLCRFNVSLAGQCGVATELNVTLAILGGPVAC